MGKWIWNVLTAMSLLVMVVGGVLWVRGYWAYDMAGWEQVKWGRDSCTSHYYGVASSQGQLWLKLTRMHLQMDVYEPEKWEKLTPAAQESFAKFRRENGERAEWVVRTSGVEKLTLGELALRSFAGFECLLLPPDDAGRWIAIPMWLVVAVAGILPLRWAERRWNRKALEKAQGGETGAGLLAPAIDGNGSGVMRRQSRKYFENSSMPVDGKTAGGRMGAVGAREMRHRGVDPKKKGLGGQ